MREFQRLKNLVPKKNCAEHSASQHFPDGGIQRKCSAQSHRDHRGTLPWTPGYPTWLPPGDQYLLIPMPHHGTVLWEVPLMEGPPGQEDLDSSPHPVSHEVLSIFSKKDCIQVTELCGNTRERKIVNE